MRSEKTNAEYFSRPSKVCGKLAAEYLEATSTGYSGLADQFSTIDKQKTAMLDSRHLTEYLRSGHQVSKTDHFRDLTNLENSMKVQCRPREDKGQPCNHEKCLRNAKLLEKSTVMIEQLKSYVAKAAVKSPTNGPKRSACVQTDLPSPNRPDIVQTLEFAWTSNRKHISPFRLPEQKIEEYRSVATQTVAPHSPPLLAVISKSTADKSYQIDIDTERQNKLIENLRRSLEAATASKADLERQLKLLETQVHIC